MEQNQILEAVQAKEQITQAQAIEANKEELAFECNSAEYHAPTKHLISAAIEGDIEGVKQALSNGANIEGPSSKYHNRSALECASYQGHLEIVKYLVSKGADIFARDDNSLKLAIIARNEKIIDFLKDLGSEINDTDTLLQESEECESVLQTQVEESNKAEIEVNIESLPQTSQSSSIKQRVKEAGGNVNTALRISLSWVNDDDLDLHCYTPNAHIYFANKSPNQTKGRLDIDMVRGGKPDKPSVENIFWIDESDIENGEYIVKVRQYLKKSKIDEGFVVEIDFKGKVWNFKSTVNGNNDDMHVICKFHYHDKNFTFTKI